MNKPRLILHIGHGKTGTTSIQNFLARNSKNILKLGYLYPIRHSPRNNHVVLRAGFLQPENLRVHDYQVYAGDNKWFIRDYERFWNTLRNNINLHKPHTVILSAEQMFRDFTGATKTGLQDFFSQLFSHVLVVCYVRSPISNYISAISQRIKVGVDSLDITHRPIKKNIEYYEEQFPGHVRIHAFERGQLIAGDVLTDFITRYIPDITSLLEQNNTKPINTSPPWELLTTLRKARLKAQPEGSEPLMETRMLMALLARKYRADYGSTSTGTIKIKTLPRTKDLLTRSAGDYLWLRDKYGVTFSDLDYGHIDPGFTLEQRNMSHNTVKLSNIMDLSAINEAKLDTGWHDRKGFVFYYNYFLFILRLRAMRIYYIYIRHHLI